MSKVFIEDENKNILANANEEPFVVDQVGTDCFINGVRQNRLDFTSDPQEQLDKKQDKLSQAQLQAIGEVDAVKSIALRNQSDVTLLASKVETNTSAIDKRLKGAMGYLDSNKSITIKNHTTYLTFGGGYTITKQGEPTITVTKSAFSFLHFVGNYLTIRSYNFNTNTFETFGGNNLQDSTLTASVICNIIKIEGGGTL